MHVIGTMLSLVTMLRLEHTHLNPGVIVEQDYFYLDRELQCSTKSLTLVEVMVLSTGLHWQVYVEIEIAMGGGDWSYDNKTGIFAWDTYNNPPATFIRPGSGSYPVIMKHMYLYRQMGCC